ncbi:hypothetical protein WN944_021905 [Citrus x changshan-huyou]|uniref:Uncharacterized protein n=1 Tax=Citrus x changshan-huyou TaxID=2935761 RepID=A0AAP0MXN6_9ROSI
MFNDRSIISKPRRQALKRMLERDPSSVDEVGLRYGRRVNGSKQMVSEHRTPLMVAAATHGGLDDVLELSLYCCILRLT